MSEQMPRAKEHIPVYNFTIIRTDGTTVTTTGTDFGDEGEWTVFSDMHGTTLRIRRALVAEITRGEKIGDQEVDVIA